jgi:LmbE family N-acetylglucosaminyl deacetylase
MNRVRDVARAGMLWVARDETTRSAERSALVLAPHPDDETLGCGATILRKIQAGTRVTVAVVTDGRHSHRSEYLTPDELAALRRLEMVEAASRLGLSSDAVRWGGFVDGTLNSHSDALVAFVRSLINELTPDEVYATCADEAHPDHAAVGRAARRAVAQGSARLLEYPVWLWGSWPLRRGDRAKSTAQAIGRLLRRDVMKVRVDGHLDGKLHALQAHASQLRRPDRVPVSEEWPALPAYLLAAARDRAELFMPWRHRSAVV